MSCFVDHILVTQTVEEEAVMAATEEVVASEVVGASVVETVEATEEEAALVEGDIKWVQGQFPLTFLLCTFVLQLLLSLYM